MGRLTLVLLLAVVALGAGVYVAFRHVPTILGETGCTAGTGHAAVALDPQQAQIAATIAEDWDTCRALRAPVRRVCTPAVPIPFSPPLEDFVLPDQGNISAAIRESLGYAEVRV